MLIKNALRKIKNKVNFAYKKEQMHLKVAKGSKLFTDVHCLHEEPVKTPLMDANTPLSSTPVHVGKSPRNLTV
jgi:hypothetical protein